MKKLERDGWASATPRLPAELLETARETLFDAGEAGSRCLLDVKFIVPLLVPLLMPFVKILSTPKRAGRMLAQLLTDPVGRTGVYFDERGQPMSSSPLVRDPAFQDRVVSETRALLATVPA